MRLFRLVLAVIVLGLSGSAFAGSEYRIGPRDRISVLVYGEADLSRTLPVAVDGTVKLPLIGRIEVGGLTVAEAEKKITALYGADYLQSPQVEVQVREYKSQSIHLLGAVNKPGVYPLTGSTRVLDIVGRGGGVADRASRFLLIIRTQAVVASGNPDEHTAMGLVRTHPGAPVRVDLHQLLAGDLGQNLPVRAGDLLFVPRAEEIYLLGEVRSPGAVPFSEGLTLLQAITKAGGFTKVAQERKVQVIRIVDGKETQRTFNMKRVAAGKEKDFALQPEDLVVVPESIL